MKLSEQLEQEVKKVVSGYLMEISSGYIDTHGNWRFIKETDFDKDLNQACSKFLSHIQQEIEKMRLEHMADCPSFDDESAIYCKCGRFMYNNALEDVLSLFKQKGETTRGK